MSDLTYAEKRKLEQLFEMGSGYVLDFSDRTFREFVSDSTARDISSETYKYASGSKANRLRKFWASEPNLLVAKLTSDLIDYVTSGKGADSRFLEECRSIVRRLKKSSAVTDIDALTPNSIGVEFELLADSVKESIHQGKPEVGLDRLHTFTTKFVRTACARQGIAVDKDNPLHSAFGQYVKLLRKQGLIRSEMTERILKTQIGILESFNDVRNNQSLAHDNKILSYNESLLIVNNVCSAIRFIQRIEEAGPVAKS
jgi:hypothetical protein